MKGVLLYLLSFLLSAALGFGGVFLIKQAGDKEPQPEPPAKVQNAVAEIPAVLPSAQEAEAEADVKPEVSAGFIVITDNRKVTDATGSNFNLSGFTVGGTHGGTVEYVLRDQQDKFSQTSSGGSFTNVPSGKTYYISARDVLSGKVTAEEEFQLKKKLTAKEIETVINEPDPDVYDRTQKKLTDRMPGYKMTCNGYKNVKTISEVRDLFENVPSLKGKKAYVSNISYSNKGIIKTFEVTLR